MGEEDAIQIPILIDDAKVKRATDGLKDLERQANAAVAAIDKIGAASNTAGARVNSMGRLIDERGRFISANRAGVAPPAPHIPVTGNAVVSATAGSPTGTTGGYGLVPPGVGGMPGRAYGGAYAGYGYDLATPSPDPSTLPRRAGAGRGGYLDQVSTPADHSGRSAGGVMGPGRDDLYGPQWVDATGRDYSGIEAEEKARRKRRGQPSDADPDESDSDRAYRMARRAGAQARLGWGVAQGLQDTIQGGSPAYALNNAMQLGADSGVKELVKDFVAAQGGAVALAGKLGAIGIAAGSAFAVVSEGLKDSRLEWSDFDDVIGNIPFVGKIVDGFGTVIGAAKEAGSAIFEQFTDGLGIMAQYTIGLGDAAEETRRQKEETEELTASLNKAFEAEDRLAKIRSKQGKETDERGEMVGQELATMGGEDGIAGLIDLMAGGDPDRRNKLNTLFDQAVQGDTEAIRPLIPEIQEATGTGAFGLLMALDGDDPAKFRKDQEAKQKRGIEEAQQKAEADLDAANQEAAASLQGRYDRAMAAGRDFSARAEMDRAGLGGDAHNVTERLAKSHKKRAGQLAGREGITYEEAQSRLATEGLGEDERAAAEGLQKRYDTARLYGEEFDVAERMDSAGLKGDAEAVEAALEKNRRERISELAAKEGLDFDEAEIRMATEDMKKDDALQKKKEREAVEKADKASAGSALDARGQLAMARSMLAGGSIEAILGRVEKGMKGELVKRGLSEEEASLASEKKTRDLFDKMSEDAIEGAMVPDARAPRSLSSMDLNAAIQGGQQSPELNELKAHKELLERIARATEAPRRAALGA